MSSVRGMILQWGSTIKVSIELTVATRHRHNITEKLLKVTLNPNKQQQQHFKCILAHLSRRLTRWAYRMGLEPASVRPSVRPSKLSNMNISETSWPITTKFYLKHHWGGGKAALGFDADQIRTLVSMATDSSHRVIMGKRASSCFLDCFWSDPFYTCR